MEWVILILVIAVVVAIAAARLTWARLKRPPAPSLPITVKTQPQRSPTAPTGPPQRPCRGTTPLTWFGSGATLDIAGFKIRDPCVYASSDPSRRNLCATDPSEILLHAEVRRPRGTTPEMGYWPWYSRIEPEHRYAYLDWLASGKKSLPPCEGLLFLYYYGLERRLLIDKQDRA